MKNLLLIDSGVTNYETIVSSVNSDTVPFVYYSGNTRQEVLNLLTTNVERIGIVFISQGDINNIGFLEYDLFNSDNNYNFFY